MIISASRRTDISAFHSEWMMNRLRAGYCLVRNPVYRQLVYRVSLARADVDALVFITKNPSPMLQYLDEIGRMGHMCLFQVTVTGYGRDLEPGVPPKASVTEAFRRISEKLGPDRIAWRYDPIIINERHSLAWHSRKFETLCGELEGYTDRCIFSFLDMYGKLSGHSDLLRSLTSGEMDAMAAMMSKTAEKHGIGLSYCCPRYDLSAFGIDNLGCIDRRTMTHLGIPFEDEDSKLRDGCRCIKSIDIGEYNTCAHGCLYCYANSSDPSTREGKVYDPSAEMLSGSPGPEDEVVPLKGREVPRITDFFDYTQYGRVRRRPRPLPSLR